MSEAPSKIARRGLMLVLSSPSGAGKTTLARGLLESDAGISMSVSVTTRKPRPGEIDGVDYTFVDQEEFGHRRDRDEFLEWALVFDHFYATPRAAVEAALVQGKDVLFDIDWQGADKLRKSVGGDMVSIFVLPPSADALEERLKARAQDPAEVVRRRMAGASNEIQHWDDYDYVVVNRDRDSSLGEVKAILTAERLKRTRRRKGLEALVNHLQDGLVGR